MIPFEEKPQTESKETATLTPAPGPDPLGYKKSAAFIHRIILSKLLRIGTLLFIAVIVPILIYLLVFSRTIGPMESFPVPTGTCSHLRQFRVRCGENLTQTLCVGRGCCYSADYGCYHFMPSKLQYWTHELVAQNEQQSTYSLIPMSPTSAQGFTINENVLCDINEISGTRLQIMVRNMPISSSAEVGTRPGSDSILYYYEVSSPIFHISVYRKDEQQQQQKQSKLLLSTHRGAFVVTLNYIEWSFYLGTDILIGFGDLRLRPGSRTVLSTGQHPNVPFILAFEPEDQKYHGIYLHSLYPIEVEVTDSYLIVIRGFYDQQSYSMELIVGEDLDSLQKQLINIIGPHQTTTTSNGRGNNLQYGLHICDSEGLFSGDYDKIAADLGDYLQPEFLQTIPFDSHCITERIASLNQEMPAELSPFLGRFKTSNKSVILHLVLRLRCSDDINNNSTTLKGCDSISDFDVLLRPSSSSSPIDNLNPYVTRVEGKEYILVDWGSQSIPLSLADLLKSTINGLYLGLDGVVLQGNWLQDVRSGSSSNDPIPDSFPYVPKDFLQIATTGVVPPWKVLRKVNHTAAGETASSETEPLLRTYNLYSHQSVRLVSEYLREQLGDGSPLFLSSESSSYPHINTVLRGIDATWVALNATRSEILSNSLTGLHSINANICGDEVPRNYPARLMDDEMLCVRWYQFASLTSMYRVLTTASPHRFSKFYQKVLARTTRLRYSLSSYFQTVSTMFPHRAINTPLFYDYPDLYADSKLNSMWMTVGPSLFAAPIIAPEQHVLEVRLPEISFEFNDGVRIPRNSTVALSIIASDLPVFIKGGNIVAVHTAEASMSVAEAQQEDLMLVIALLPTSSSLCDTLANDGACALGWLSIDNGILIEFYAVQNGSLATVTSRSSDGNLCGEASATFPGVVRGIKWFGVADDEETESYRSWTCYLENPVDLCAEVLNYSLDIAGQTNCTFIQH